MKSFFNIKALAFLAGTLFFAVNGFSQNISDKELKTNLTPISRSLDYIQRLQPVTFEYDTNKFKQFNMPKGMQYGFVADDVYQVLPALLSSKAKNYSVGKNDSRTAIIKTINADTYIPLLVAAIKEQQEEIESLKAALQNLKSSSNSAGR